MDLMIYSTKITLYNSYFDLNDRLTAKSILNIFQDVASIHAEQIGVGFENMFKQNLYWVLSRIKFDILNMPTPNQTIIVETWPHEKGRIDFDRDMRILSETGEVLIIASSKWCVIDTINRRLQRSDNINYNGQVYNQVNYIENFNKIELPSCNFEYKHSYVVQFSDLDHNQHMNNTNYATLISNTINNKIFSHFEINFLNECLINDTIDILSICNQNGEYIFGNVNDKKAFVAFIK